MMKDRNNQRISRISINLKNKKEYILQIEGFKDIKHYSRTHLFTKNKEVILKFVLICELSTKNLI